MIHALRLTLPLLLLTAAAEAAERRCGWYDNPTPGNHWLTDRDGQWVLLSQGMEPPEGMEGMRDMTAAGWVATNGSYGYGCACVTLEADRVTRRVTRILAGESLPLTRCRADRSLPGR
ncbi:DUF4087 domain-containing protein [Roseomonas hellenica]|uniref:DUF4087 domain-containing protein n=1 Tax=Plastoroseomonas hellenica TaxID=2687306 RepID=A0ABS5EXX2_9PROT|nr:DUF4087 domain-containing protein [Plastoroseomonas hellenica]